MHTKGIKGCLALLYTTPGRRIEGNRPPHRYGKAQSPRSQILILFLTPTVTLLGLRFRYNRRPFGSDSLQPQILRVPSFPLSSRSFAPAFSLWLPLL